MILFFRLQLGCILQLLPFSVLCLYPFHGHFRVSNRTTFLETAALITILGGFFSHICLFLADHIVSREHRFLISNLVFIGCLIPCLVWFLFIVKDIWQKKLFIFLFSVISAMAMTSLVNTLMTLLCINTGEKEFPYQGYTNLILFGFTAIVLPALILLLQKRFVPVADSLTPKEYSSLCILSIILFVILGIAFVIIPAEYSDISNPFSVVLYSTLMISVFLIYYMIFYIFQMSKTQLLAEQRLQQSQMQIQIQAEQYRQLMNKIAETKRLRHDYRHHLITLENYLVSGETDQLHSYLKQHLNYTEELAIEKYCENETINYLVSHYMSLCKEHNIALKPLIQYPATFFLSTPELSVLLGNLLENAYTATLDAPSKYRFINLNIMVKGTMLVITSDNGFDGFIKEKNGKIESKKENHEGLGLASIKSIVEKYNGTVEFLHDDIEFHVNILMKDNYAEA